MRKKVCKKCRIFVQGKQCPICKKSDFSTSWKGRVYVLDVKKSHVAKQIDASVKGEYAIRT